MSETASPSLKDITKKLEKHIQPTEPPLLVFGNGPVMSGRTFLSADHVVTREDIEADPALSPYEGKTPRIKDATVSHLARNSAWAAAYLRATGAVGDVIFSGGETGGDGFGSEAKHMDKLYQRRLRALKAEMAQKGLSVDGIEAQAILEEEAMDTPLNIIKALNMYTEKDTPFQEMEFSVMGGTWHTNRIKFFMKALGCKTKHTFAAEEVLRHEARSPIGSPAHFINNKEGALDQWNEWDQKELQRIEDMVDPDDSHYYDKKRGVERADFHSRLTRDTYWVRETLQFPARMLSVITDIKSDAHLKEVLRRLSFLYTPEQLAPFGIDLNEDADAIRAKLRAIKWPDYAGEAKKHFGVEADEKAAKELFINEWNTQRTQVVEEKIDIAGKPMTIRGRGWPRALEQRYERFMDPATNFQQPAA